MVIPKNDSLIKFADTFIMNYNILSTICAHSVLKDKHFPWQDLTCLHWGLVMAQKVNEW